MTATVARSRLEGPSTFTLVKVVEKPARTTPASINPSLSFPSEAAATEPCTLTCSSSSNFPERSAMSRIADSPLMASSGCGDRICSRAAAGSSAADGTLSSTASGVEAEAGGPAPGPRSPARQAVPAHSTVTAPAPAAIPRTSTMDATRRRTETRTTARRRARPAAGERWRLKSAAIRARLERGSGVRRRVVSSGTTVACTEAERSTASGAALL